MLNGAAIRDAMISAANNIANNRQAVDALNVFPVPDGDTGTNMSMTMSAAKRELLLQPDTVTAGDAAQVAAAALLRGARGNSGVILSLLFRGFAKGLHGKTEADAESLAHALEIGVDAAYKAVMKPTEGTMLTVARESAQKATEALHQNKSLTEAALFKIVVDESKESLARTPELLPVLKKAGVVDAGGRGLVLAFEGMYSVFSGGGIIPDKKEALIEIPDERNAAGEYEGEITFTYCTEFIVVKEPGAANTLSLRAYLESIGDSVVVVDDDEIIKCHVHTDNPGNALQKALESGPLSNMKIENMREQHAAQKRGAAQKSASPAQKFQYASVDPEREYGFVAVASGDGVTALLKDLGADNVVSGGQTMNPSTDDILDAIHATPAKTVIVLPNNKNIIMAAEQTVKLADRNVYVLPTKSIPQGLASLIAFDPELKLSENQLAMIKAIERVGTGQITFAARDSVLEGHKIKKDEILALENGKVSFSDKDVNKAALKLVRSLVKRDSAFVTLLYGQEVTEEQAGELHKLLEAKLPDSIELMTLSGGQPVYYYIISVE